MYQVSVVIGGLVWFFATLYFYNKWKDTRDEAFNHSVGCGLLVAGLVAFILGVLFS